MTHFPEVPVMDQVRQVEMTPADALTALRAGNERFVKRMMHERDLPTQVRATAEGQYPFAAVLACLDSRVPPELVFDQGVGDLFCARVAGNFVNTDIIGSFEFATKLAGAKLIVVMGHTCCGAVKGACDRVELGHLTHTLSNLEPAVASVQDIQKDRTSSNSLFVHRVAEANVRMAVTALTERSAILSELVEAGELRVVGAMYDVATGEVTFYG